MKIKDIHLGENNQKTENKNEYIPGSSEKKRASVMYLFFGIIASLSKTEFSPFEYYHLKQSIWLRIAILPVVLISFVPVLKWIWILILVILIAILWISFYHAWSWKYFENSKNVALSLFSWVWWRFIDLFDLWIKSTADDLQNWSNQSQSSKSENKKTTLDELQKQDTSLQEDFDLINNSNSDQNTTQNN